MSHEVVPVDIWPPENPAREEVSFLQLLVSVSLLLKTALLISSFCLLIVSILYQVYSPVTCQSIGSISIGILMVPVTCISLVSDSLHFRMKFVKYRSLLVLLGSPFWSLGCIASVFELVITGFLIILIKPDSSFLIYFLIVNHIFEVSLTLTSVVISLIAWRLITLRQTYDGVTDVNWNVNDVITYTPRY